MAFNSTVCPISVRMPMTCLIVHADLPSDEQVIAAAREVLEASKGWKKGKTYQKNTVRTYSRPKGPGDGAPWYCRVSEHTADEATFDEFWSKIGFDHAENEKEYACPSQRSAYNDGMEQVHRYREENHIDQEDFHDARNLVIVLRISILRCFSSRVYCFTNNAL